ncbi:MAG: M20/M25/M40 family metallo-hydrolase [Phycisphaerales bacterium]
MKMDAARRERVLVNLSQRRAAMLHDLRLFVETPTGPGPGMSDGLARLRQHIAERCVKLGASVELVPGTPRPAWLAWNEADRAGDGASADAPPTRVCRRSGGGRDGREGGGVLLSGHLDTVHATDGPFRELKLAADHATATGPGVVDMKGGLVIAMHALEALAEVGVEVPGGWGWILNSDEETGSFHSDAALRAEASRTLEGGARAYGVGIALEPAMSKGELAIARGGSGQFMIEAFGKNAHVGRDFASGVSATRLLSEAVLKATSLTDLSKGLAVNVGPMRCDQPPNVVPDYARAWGNVRYPTPEGAAVLEAGLAALEFGQAPPGSATGGVRVRRVFNRPAKPTTDGTRTLAERARRVCESLGQSLPFASTAGVCDGNNLQAAGLATIDTLGVRGGGLHTPTEWIEIASLVERAQVLAMVMAGADATK